MSPLQLWRREFKRSSAPDHDVVASKAFLKANVTDFFGNWIQEKENAQIKTFDEILMKFWEGSKKSPPPNSFSIFCVADGGEIPSTPDNKAWIERDVRFVAVIASGNDGPFSTAQDSWTVFIVGPDALDAERAFMQVASWDGKEFRFYSRDVIQNGNVPRGTLAWLYQAKSTDAFTDQTSYLGPFNGHVNGAVIMKELRKPWLHWMSADSNIVANLSPKDKKRFARAPYLSSSTDGLCGRVATPEILEQIVEAGVDSWYDQRKMSDFGTAGSLNPVATNAKRWMAHILLTTTINIRPAAKSVSSGDKWNVPADHFYNNELLSVIDQSPALLTGVKVPNFSFKMPQYQKAADKLKLVLLQPVAGKKNLGNKTLTLPRGTLGGGKLTGSYGQTKFAVVADGEAIPFTILHTPYEDSHGGSIMQKIYAPKDGPRVSLISPQTFNALMMVDFWNPVYSWRRATLAEYVPETAAYDDSMKKYDLEDVFINKVKKSTGCKNDPTSPESQFISLLNTSTTTFRTRIQSYLNAVEKRLATDEGLLDYLKLAESRRRIYRPVPLDEFGPTLPYALKYSEGALFEMTEDGKVVPMADRGVELFKRYTIGNPKKNEPGSLAGLDPHIFPAADSICPARRHRRAVPTPGVAAKSTWEKLDIGWHHPMIEQSNGDFPLLPFAVIATIIFIVVIATTLPKLVWSHAEFMDSSAFEPQPRVSRRGHHFKKLESISEEEKHPGTDMHEM